jgi:molybdopterin synthase sulfur carrier subunit
MLAARGGAWAAELATGRAVRVALNHVMCPRETPVHAGDEVALFPPVTGG